MRKMLWGPLRASLFPRRPFFLNYNFRRTSQDGHPSDMRIFHLVTMPTNQPFLHGLLHTGLKFHACRRHSDIRGRHRKFSSRERRAAGRPLTSDSSATLPKRPFFTFLGAVIQWDLEQMTILRTFSQIISLIGGSEVHILTNSYISCVWI